MQVAIEMALTALGWYENLQEEEVPPEHLWADSAGLEMWWKTVEAKRDDGVSTVRGRGDDGEDEADEPGMVENDLARYVK